MCNALILMGFISMMSSQLGYSASKTKTVLIVLSSSDHISLQEGGKYKTGLFLSELTKTMRVLTVENIGFSFATPSGQQGTIDPASEDAKWFSSAQEYQADRAMLMAHAGFAKPRTLASLSESELAEFAGVFIPGGYAPMEDLPLNGHLGRILNHFHAFGKPTALICHGPVALLSQKLFSKDGAWAYSGYKLTIVSKAEEIEEEEAGHIGGKQQYYVEDALRSGGAEVIVAKPWTTHVLRDREVITGQNPMSADAIAAAFAKALRE